MFVRGSKNSKLFAPSRLQFREHMVAVWNASPPLLAICDPDHHDRYPWKVAAPQTSRPSSFQRPPRLPVHQLEALYKQEAPAGDRGSRSRMDAKILHLWLALFGLGVPNAACLGAVSLCLRLRHVR